MSFLKDEVPLPQHETLMEPKVTDLSDHDGSEIISTHASKLCPASKTSTSESVGRKRKSANDIGSEFLELERKRMEMYMENENRTAKNSEDYHYLMSLLPQMQNFTPAQKFRVRNKINNIMITEIESKQRF